MQTTIYLYQFRPPLIPMPNIRPHLRVWIFSWLWTKLHCSPLFSDEDSSDAMYSSYIHPNVVPQNWMVRIAVRRVMVKSMNEAPSIGPARSFSMNSTPMNALCQTKLSGGKPSKRHQSLTHSKGHDASMNQSYVLLKQRYSNSQSDEVYTRVCFISMCSSNDLTLTWEI